jgi:hypothetical protein
MIHILRQKIRDGCFGIGTMVALATGVCGQSRLDFMRAPEMFFVTWDSKQAVFPQEAITADMRKHINAARWSKGQHKLPDVLIGWEFDLNKDGVVEFIIETGEWGGHQLVLRILNGNADIIGALGGSFGLIRRENGWDEIVALWSPDSRKLVKEGLRFDGRSYKRVWRVEEEMPESEEVRIENAPSTADKPSN